MFLLFYLIGSGEAIRRTLLIEKIEKIENDNKMLLNRIEELEDKQETLVLNNDDLILKIEELELGIDELKNRSCECNEGLNDDNVDTDECEDPNACSDHAECTNTVGSYTCKCQNGFAGDGHDCVDVDECSTSNICGENEHCLNTIGSYVCEKRVEKDVLVLSTFRGERKPMIISFDGKSQSKEIINYIQFKGNYREASFQYGSSTEIENSCSVEYNNEFYIFGGSSIRNQVNE